MNPIFTRVGGQALDGEVVCRRCGKALNRTDLNCWSCGSRELEVVGAALKQLRELPEPQEEVAVEKPAKAPQHSPGCAYRRHGLKPCPRCNKPVCQSVGMCAPCYRSYAKDDTYKALCPAATPA